ncbi:GNAT family N-acetyltransferase [Yinghuangia seranimata]|uniref:GNAT family N-acetyltransferase n=1 Tax=Yinghuangia seranimata TaxID=408067 RepID=UPI00248B35DE|nr:GNAT family N-acetyltransferase [Yinghuangia seranimata]MDI2132299.1 GNAT family N-acetyltransferase [Yinghuangia seranimata]
MIEMHVLSADDWPLWRDLRLQALTEAPNAFGTTLAEWQGDGDREERWRARLDIPGSYNLVALVNGRPSAMASGIPGPDEEPGVAELISMFVTPPARGHGVVDALIADIARWAAERGNTVLRLSVVPDNTRATHAYERNGFQHTDILGDPTPDGLSRELVMELPLA